MSPCFGTRLKNIDISRTLLEMNNFKAGGITQCLRVLTRGPDFSSQNSHQTGQADQSILPMSVLKDLTPFSGPRRHQAHKWCTNTLTGSSYAHKIKVKKYRLSDAFP